MKKLTKKEEEIMNLSLKVDNKKQLDRMEYNVGQRPEVVYRGLMAVLTGEVNYLID